jgi:hypothetical protein
MNYLNPANSLCEAMGGGKERVAPGCLSPGASLRVDGVFRQGAKEEKPSKKKRDRKEK